MSSTFTTPITRLYIDTRPLQPSPQPAESLPLFTTLRPADQKSITSFLRHPDRLMSLASQLLKYHFIHRTARLPWSQVTISRWPPPHKRPYWDPPDHWTGNYGLEFNVSHQAGMVALLGCRTPHRTSTEDQKPDPMVASLSDQSTSSPPQNPRLGVDIACTDEPRRTPTHLKTPADLSKWIDIFSEMFSERERHDMKRLPVSPSASTSSSTQEEIPLKLRRFYTYWSLKEAFIKMVGEGLLASWLRELEFIDVQAPPRPLQHIIDEDNNDDESDKFTPTPHTIHNGTGSTDFKILLRHRPIPAEEVYMEVVGYEDDFLFATAVKGVQEESESESESHVPITESESEIDLAEEEEKENRGWVEGRGGRGNKGGWIKIDIERDVRPCAEGRCGCLDS